MRKVVCVVIILMISFSVLYSGNDNILEIEGQKIYFSLSTQINYQYYTIDYKKYSDVLRNFYIEIVGKDDPNKIYQSPININLPDSLTTDYFVIKKGYSVVLVDSTDLKHFKINDFETTTSIEGSGKSRVLFSVPDSIAFDRKNLFLISENKSVFQNLKSCNTSKIIDPNVELAIYKKITDFFYNNRKILDRQMTNIPKISDTLSYDQFENEIIDNFSLNIFQLDSGGFFFEGSCNKYKYHKFFAVISEDYEKLNYNRHMKFYLAFKLNDVYYFFCKSYLPNTGGNIIYVFKLIGQDLITVFKDGSHSM